MACKILQKKGVFYRPIFASDFVRYQEERDQILGWPSPKSFEIESSYYNESGARYSPAFPDPDRVHSCISLYGDSFTQGSQVAHAYTWGNVLATYMKCGVANYGVGGYGTDQAYLRFKHNTEDHAKVVVLAHLSENILRNVNQFRGFLSPGQAYGLKPRFIVDSENKLRLIPLPVFSKNDYESFVRDPHLHLAHDYFIPGGASGTQYLGPPYSRSAMQSFTYFRIRARLSGRPSYAEFYERRHASKGLAVTTRIIKAFYEDAIVRGKTPLVILLPTIKDLTFHQKHGSWIYQNLIETLKASRIETLNIGDRIINDLSGSNPSRFFAETTPHPNREGNKVIASEVYNYLVEMNQDRYRLKER